MTMRMLILLVICAVVACGQSGRVVPLLEADTLTARITYINMKEAEAAWEELRIKLGEKYLTVPWGDPDSSGAEYMRPSDSITRSFITTDYGDLVISNTPRPQPTEAEKKAREERRQRELEEWKKRAVFFRKGWDEHAGGSGSLPLFEFSGDFRFMVPGPSTKTEPIPVYHNYPYLVPRW